MGKIKIRAEGDNCQAAHTINNYSLSSAHVQNLCDWVMIGSGVIMLFSITGLIFAKHDFWATMLCLIIFGVGMFLFLIAFLPFICLEYGVKKND
uniref:hypothetical protein n=1 Tax=uncultured Acinetobacter sp. TaxID=165433 RepID=UPI00261D990E|nr:hypothetical protein [uncultured Acinetobacter sp.]